jgi:MYXO-CTERM domain-containing protein
MTRKMILSAMLFGIMAFAISIPVSAVPAPLHHWDASNPYGNGTAPVNGANLTGWVDLAGGNTASKTFGNPTYVAGNSSTIGGMPTFRFTPGDAFTADNSIVDQSVTVFSVSKMNAGATRRLITSHISTANYLLGYWNGAEDRAYNGGFFGGASGVTDNAHMYIHEARNDGTDILRDGSTVIANTAGAGAATPIGRLGFGGRNWSAAESSYGDVSEIIVYDSNLSAADFNTIGLGLAQKYNLDGFGNVATVDNVAEGKAIVDGSSSWNGQPYNGGSFPGSKITDGVGNDLQDNITYWLGSQNALNEYLVVDLGADVDIERLGLQNTHNRGSHDRGTRDFNVSVRTNAQGQGNGANAGEWTQILNGTLADVRGDDDGLQTIQYNVNSTTGRYVRFEAVNGWGASSGLNELEVYANQDFDNGGNHALNRPVIDGSGSWNNNTFNSNQNNVTSNFNAQQVTDGSTADSFGNNYWLGRQGVRNEYFTLDLGGIVKVDRIELTNSANGGDSGTQNFRIYASNEVDINNLLIDATLILSGQLSDMAGVAPGLMLTPDIFTSADGLLLGKYRYLRFEALDFRAGDARVGLNEIRVFTVPEPATAMLGLLGLAGLARRRRRSA